ncbi:hypothetical protein ACFY9F_35615 [Streptomyces sp. NPDC012421]|uniref:hypothetical protein n=1 Tax=Streptomyces sp. NPDC012421 TaxID=3364832 RepID=UPI0036E423D4
MRTDHELRGSPAPVDSIATRNGYANARALRRAVQRWHGTTPAALRNNSRRTLMTW